MFANHAETPPNGLLYISGGAWDTINVAAPLPEGALPPGADEAVAVFQGSIVLRVLFHRTEAGRPHSIGIVISDADGAQINAVEGVVDLVVPDDHPAGWDIGVNAAIPLSGLPLPRFGQYQVSVTVDGHHVDDLPFRVVKHYE